MTIELEKQRANVTQSPDTLNTLAQDNASVAKETSTMSEKMAKAMEYYGN